MAADRINGSQSSADRGSRFGLVKSNRPVRVERLAERTSRLTIELKSIASTY